MTSLKPKRQGGGLMMRTIIGKSGQTYLASSAWQLPRVCGNRSQGRGN